MSRKQTAGRAGLSLTVAAAFGAAFSLSANAALKEPLKLDSGEIGGSVESAPGIRAFKGIDARPRQLMETLEEDKRWLKEQVSR